MLRPLKARAREMSRDLWASDAIFVDRAKSTTAQPTGFYGFALHTVELRVSETVGSTLRRQRWLWLALGTTNRIHAPLFCLSGNKI